MLFTLRVAQASKDGRLGLRTHFCLFVFKWDWLLLWLLLHDSLNYEIHNIHKKEDARAVLVNATIENQDVTICNMYAPNPENERKDFFKKMKIWIARHSDFLDSMIIGGDFNCALNQNDRTGPNRDSSRDVLKNLLRNLKLCDAWFLKHNVPQYTFHDNSSNSKSRIDYFFLSKTLQYKILGISLKEAPIRDGHKGVYLTYNFKNKNRGPINTDRLG